MSGEKIIPTRQYELTCPGAQSTKKRFQFSNFLWPKFTNFSKKSHFLPLNGWNTCHNLAQSCPRGWQRLTPKKSVVALKVYHNKWDCGGYIPPLRILRRLYAEESIKKHQKLSKTPEHTKNHQQHPPTNQHVPPIWFQVTFCISDGEKC